MTKWHETYQKFAAIKLKQLRIADPRHAVLYESFKYDQGVVNRRWADFYERAKLSWPRWAEQYKNAGVFRETVRNN